MFSLSSEVDAETIRSGGRRRVGWAFATQILMNAHHEGAPGVKKLLLPAMRVPPVRPVASDDQHEPQPVRAPRGRGAAADVEALERELALMSAQLAETERALAELERQRAEMVGTAENVRQAMTDLGQDLVQRRETLAKAEREQAGKALRDSLAERDAVAVRLAKHLRPLLDDIAALDDARSQVTAAHARLRKLEGPQALRPVPPEPPELADRWKWLITRAGAEFDSHLADELLDAAARSPLGHAIEDLPAHLREAARQRRRLLRNEARLGLGVAEEAPHEGRDPE